MRHTLVLLAVLAFAWGCSSPAEVDEASQEKNKFMQEETDLLAGEVMALAYSGFREGQHPDRGFGARNPSPQQILEDLQIMEGRAKELFNAEVAKAAKGSSKPGARPGGRKR